MNKRKRKKIRRMQKRATVKCRKCGKEFQQVLAGVWYCSGQCERLAANPVAKFLNFFKSGSGVHKNRKKYDRKKYQNEQLY